MSLKNVHVQLLDPISSIDTFSLVTNKTSEGTPSLQILPQVGGILSKRETCLPVVHTESSKTME